VELSDNVQFSTFQRKGSILTEEAKSRNQKPEKLRNLRLHLKKINKTTQEKELVELKDDDLSLFYYGNAKLIEQIKMIFKFNN